MAAFLNDAVVTALNERAGAAEFGIEICDTLAKIWLHGRRLDKQQSMAELLQIEVSGLDALVIGRVVAIARFANGDKAAVVGLVGESGFYGSPGQISAVSIASEDSADEHPATAALHSGLVPLAIAEMEADEAGMQRGGCW